MGGIPARPGTTYGNGDTAGVCVRALRSLRRGCTVGRGCGEGGSGRADLQPPGERRDAAYDDSVGKGAA